MQSQRLIIDTIKTWSKDRLYVKADVLDHEVDYARLWLVTSEPEYVGVPTCEVIILWDRDHGVDEHPEWHGLVHQLVRSFAHQSKLTVTQVTHKGLTTYVKFKVTESSINCEDFSWIDVIAPKPDVI